MFRSYLAAVVAYVTIFASVAFGEVAVQRMVPDAEAKSWYGIAKLNVAGTRWCNAVLISETEALTAAHCLFHQVTLHLAEAKDIKVILGQRRNEYAALRGVTDHAVLPGFSPELGDSADLDQIAFDLAILRLDAPVSIDEIRPFEVSDWLANQIVSVTGYGRDRPYLPSIREDCVLTPISTHVARLGCTIVPGLSGAAVIGEQPSNRPRPLVGIVSANLHDPTGMKTGEALIVGIGSRLEVLRGHLP
jgi:protease YdgD